LRRTLPAERQADDDDDHFEASLERFWIAAETDSTWQPAATIQRTHNIRIHSGRARCPKLLTLRPSCYGQPLHRVTESRWLFKAPILDADT